MKRDVYLDDQPWEEALKKYLDFLEEQGALKPGLPEQVPAEDAVGRITAEPVFACISSPHYHAAAMDGVAVRASSTFGASDAAPLRLQLGEQAVLIDTGEPLPEGYDTVIMIEDVHFVSEDAFEIISAFSPWQNVRPIGEDIVATEMILPANHRIRPVDLGGILAGGVTEIKVHPRPRVALLATGNELVEPGGELKAGNIIEYNTRVLGALVAEWGGLAIRKGQVPDNFELLKKALADALKDADLVLINAGSSAGREDFTAALIREMGIVLVHGVATRPGKPVVLGAVNGKPVVGVPGYPVSAILATELFVRPIIYMKQGSTLPEHEKITAVISQRIVSALGMEEFLRVKLGQVGGRIIATPLARGAGLITSLIKADGILRLPRLSEGMEAGSEATVELLRPLKEIKETTVIIGSHDVALDILASYLRQKYPSTT
ncbi:MAG: molybdopterin-binding protein, partial [Dehalococcoidia bacterium]|nr:molybdopterin-binding protein [Dehalococcoidia bacterium]